MKFLTMLKNGALATGSQLGQEGLSRGMDSANEGIKDPHGQQNAQFAKTLIDMGMFGADAYQTGKRMLPTPFIGRVPTGVERLMAGIPKVASKNIAMQILLADWMNPNPAGDVLEHPDHTFRDLNRYMGRGDYPGVRKANDELYERRGVGTRNTPIVRMLMNKLYGPDMAEDVSQRGLPVDYYKDRL